MLKLIENYTYPVFCSLHGIVLMLLKRMSLFWPTRYALGRRSLLTRQSTDDAPPPAEAATACMYMYPPVNRTGGHLLQHMLTVTLRASRTDDKSASKYSYERLNVRCPMYVIKQYSLNTS